MKKFILAIASLLLAACGGGSSSGGGIPLTGPTSHPGIWELLATITVSAGGTSEALEHTTTVNIAGNGALGIQETDSTCTLSVFVNGDRLTYHEDCTVSTENGPCIVELHTTAIIVGDSLSGNFGPKSYVCLGTPVSFTGNLVGNRI